MVCDNSFCNALGKLFDCVPVVAILAMTISALGFTFTTAGTKDLIDGLQNYGINTSDFESYLLSAALCIMIVDIVVTVFAFFSTGCCKEKFFHHAKSSCGACFEWIMGPIAQVVFFFLTLGSTAIAFMASSLCLACIVISVLAESSCATNIDMEAQGQTISVKGSEILGQIVQSAELPEMLSAEIKVINGTLLCMDNDDFKKGSSSGYFGFALILFGQILFLIKITYTYLALREEMKKGEKDVSADGDEEVATYGTQLVGAE